MCSSCNVLHTGEQDNFVSTYIDVSSLNQSETSRFPIDQVHSNDCLFFCPWPHWTRGLAREHGQRITLLVHYELGHISALCTMSTLLDTTAKLAQLDKHKLVDFFQQKRTGPPLHSKTTDVVL